MLQFGCMFAQSQDRVINPNWILLDTCSTDNVFCNEMLVSDLRRCKEGDGLEIITNGGFATYDHVAESTLLPVTVYFNAESIANILSYDKISNLPNVRITSDTTLEKAIFVHLSTSNTDTTFKFSSCDDGLYYYDATHLLNNNNKSKYPINHCLSLSRNNNKVNLLNTVANNKTFFTKRQISRADLARQTQQALGWPGTNVFKQLVSKNFLVNCKFTVDDINNALRIYGPPGPLAKGRMTAPPQMSHRSQHLEIPRELLHIHKKLQLYIDLLYINKMNFFIARSDGVNYINIVHLPNKYKITIINCLQNIIKIYTSRKFIISDVYGDNEFDMDDLRQAILPARLHICAANEHVPMIERPIRTVKEKARTMCHSVPYTNYTKLMTKSLIASVTK